MKVRFETYEEWFVAEKARPFVPNDPQAIERRNVQEHEGEIAGSFCRNGELYFIVAMTDGTFRNVPVSDCSHGNTQCGEPAPPARKASKVERLANIICDDIRKPDNPIEAAIALLEGGYVSVKTAVTIARLFGQPKVKTKETLIKALKDGEIDGNVPEMRKINYQRWTGTGSERAVRMSPVDRYAFFSPSLVAWLSSNYKLVAWQQEMIDAIEQAKKMKQKQTGNN